MQENNGREMVSLLEKQQFILVEEPGAMHKGSYARSFSLALSFFFFFFIKYLFALIVPKEKFTRS